ncbi:MAG: hypothetical protein KDD46_06955 [Bdellovibrionales bacterium]|nr:hypothetical protein [Bdellovibrionales bacterium]
MKLPKLNKGLLLISFLFFFSGFFFLGIETIWIRTVGLYIGSTIVSASLVVGLYFFFAAIGGYFAYKKINKVPKVLLPYGLLEIACGVCACISYVCKDLFASLLLQGADFSYGLSVVEVLFVVLLIGIPSVLSGTIFPTLFHYMLRHASSRTSQGGWIYGANLLGASAGVVMCGVFFPQIFGYQITFFLCCIGLVSIGIFAIVLSRVESGDSSYTAGAKKVTSASNSLWVTMLLLSGLLSIALEILILMYCKQLFGISLYATQSVLLSFILGLGLASIFVSILRKKKNPKQILQLSLFLSSILCAIYPFLFFYFQHGIFQPPHTSEVLYVLSVLGFTTILLLPLLLSIGMVFPALWDLLDIENVEHGAVVGRMTFLNKIGCGIGAVLFPFFVVSILGLPGSFLLIGGFYFLLFVLIVSNKRKKFISVVVGIFLFAVATFMQKPPVVLGDGNQLIATYQGEDGIVSVFEDQKKSRHILMNQRHVLNGTQQSMLWQNFESWIPLFLHPEPKNVTFIGMASGISAVSALDFPIQRLDAVELSSNVVAAAKDHFGEWNHHLFSDVRSNVIIHDGKRFLESSKDHKDVVIITLLQPDQEGVSNLYAKEFVQVVKSKLNPRGLFCIWLPLYQLNEELVGIIIRTVREEFSNVIAVRGNMDPFSPMLGIIMSDDVINLTTSYLEKRLRLFPFIQRQTKYFQTPSLFHLLLVGDVKTQTSFDEFSQNTIDYPLIDFKGPKYGEEKNAVRGVTLLNWQDKYFSSDQYTSMQIDSTESIKKAIQAGQFFYASKVFEAPLPKMSVQESMNRLNQSITWKNKAIESVPEIQSYRLFSER